jgi:beta-lactam-binding protein with PASTA domain/tRNA A-37 threonylcarbamoyl transferase component Bud32
MERHAEMSTPRLLSNRYELGDTLGYGGMSEVHHGLDVRLSREVAIKILRADLARDPQFQERFRREAQNAAALNHPAIVAVYDTGEAQTETGNLPYIVMEYVEGRTLRDIVKTEGPMAQKRAMEVMADVCAALDFSHRHGIIHRDVKPANVMITKNGAVKVMDFGIARALHDGQSAMTQTAAVIGTAQYLSPEQARGEQVDARSDVYAAGCVLYELVTGEPPFTGDSPVAVAYQHVREDPNPPSTVNPAVSPELDAVVLKALAKGPANRYQSSAEMRSDLVRTLSGQRPSAPMVMSEDERTQVMDSDRRQPQRYDEYAGDDPEAEAKAARKRRTLIGVGVAALVIVIALVAMLLGGAFKSSANKVAITDVTHQNAVAAKDTLRAQGFTNFAPNVYVTCGGTPAAGQASCSSDDVDKVVSMTPTGGTPTATDATITLTVGKAPGAVQVPDLTGKTQAEATALLTGAGLVLNTANIPTQDVTDPNQVGLVQVQSPGANSQAPSGSSVTITLGRLKQQVNVPDVTGQQYDAARAQLIGLGFKVSKTSVKSADPVNNVTDQSIKGAPASVGTTITLSVSDGTLAQITMPDLTGKTFDQAVAQLQSMGWSGQANRKADKSSDPTSDNTVTKTDPQAGGQLGKTDAVTFYIAEGDGSSTPTTSSGIHFP